MPASSLCTCIGVIFQTRVYVYIYVNMYISNNNIFFFTILLAVFQTSADNTTYLLGICVIVWCEEDKKLGNSHFCFNKRIQYYVINLNACKLQQYEILVFSSNFYSIKEFGRIRSLNIISICVLA